MMSSTSIARQNRRKRLRQNPKDSTLSTLETLSASELKSKGKSDNSDSYSKSYTDTQSYESLELKRTQNEPYEALSFTTDSSFVNGDILSRPLEKIFIEGERGFKEINPSQIFQLSHADVTIQSHKNSPIYQALEISKYFHRLTNFCHGLLGGMSLLYLFVLLHLFLNLSVNEETVKYFSFFSKPVHNMFNFLCIICCVSVFDRLNISNTEEFFKSIKKLDLKLIALLIYPACLLLSLSTANVDDELNISEKNITSSDILTFREDTELYYWKTLSITKCFGALLGWIVICWDQNFNVFIDHLRSIQHRRNILH